MATRELRDLGGFLHLQNLDHVDDWRWRWARRGGGAMYSGHDLPDLRNAEELRRWREIEQQRNQLKGYT